MLAGRYGMKGIKCTSIARKLCEVSLEEKSSSPVAYISMRKEHYFHYIQPP